MSAFKHSAVRFGTPDTRSPDVGSSIGPISLHNAIRRSHRAPSTRALLKGAMSPKTPLKVMLVEDHLAFRQAVSFVLQSEQGLEVIAQAGTLQTQEHP